ncbi:MAG: M23 family metallopeptidase [Vicinamibacterales bacterium]
MGRLRNASIFWVSSILISTVACGGGGGGTPTSPSSGGSSGGNTQDSTPPAMTTAFVNPEQAVAFFVFGATLPSGVQNPTWEIETATQDVPVLATMSGRVMWIADTAQGDKAITIQTSDSSIYVLVHDHVLDVRVSVGQTVTAGQQIGIVGRLNNGRGRTELQLNRRIPAPEVAVCLRTFFSSAVNTAFEAASQRLNGSTNTCLAQTVAP